MPSTETRNLEKYIRDFKDEPDIAEEDKEAVMELVNALAAEGAGESRQRKYIDALRTIMDCSSPSADQAAKYPSERSSKTMPQSSKKITVPRHHHRSGSALTVR